jgi:Carboxypeptidase regulatory-like domain
MLRIAPLLFALSLFPEISESQEAATPPPAAATKQEKGGIQGVVVRKGTNEPIHFARVLLLSEGEAQQTLYASTGVDGKFAIKDVPPGKYQLAVSHTGYVPESYGSRHAMEPGEALELASGKQISDLIFRLTPAGIIAGRVRDENGEPAAGTLVRAYLTRFVKDKRSLVPVGTAITNDLGEYRLFNLTPGKYVVSAGMSPMGRLLGGDAVMSVSLAGSSEPLANAVTSYYPGTTDAELATSLAVEPGSEVRSIDFSLLPAGTFHIRGHVAGLSKDSEKNGFSGMVMLRKGGAKVSALMPEDRALVNPKDGSFDVENVVPGTYVVMAIGAANDEPRFAHKSVEVAGSDVDGVDLVFEPTVSISGHLKWDDKSSGANISLQVALEQEGEIFAGRPSAQVQPDGSFELKNVAPDDYWVNVTGPAPDAYLKSAQYGATEALNTFHVSPGGGSSLELVAGARGAHIKGVAMNSDPVPVSGVWITLLPDGENRKRKRLYQSTRTGAGGKFELRGVAPGDYTLFAWDNVEEEEWSDPDFLKPFKTKGVSITVREGETKSVDVTVIQTSAGEVKK